jgi:hypothetical protein
MPGLVEDVVSGVKQASDILARPGLDKSAGCGPKMEKLVDAPVVLQMTHKYERSEPTWAEKGRCARCLQVKLGNTAGEPFELTDWLGVAHDRVG